MANSHSWPWNPYSLVCSVRSSMMQAHLPLCYLLTPFLTPLQLHPSTFSNLTNFLPKSVLSHLFFPLLGKLCPWSLISCFTLIILSQFQCHLLRETSDTLSNHVSSNNITYIKEGIIILCQQELSIKFQKSAVLSPSYSFIHHKESSKPGI